MNRKSFYILTLLLFVCTVLGVQAQERNRTFEVYDASNGLTINRVQSVKCTEKGRIMSVTREFINFFDGYGFTHINYTDNNIYPLPKYKGGYEGYFDHYNHFWMKNDGVLLCINMDTETFITDIAGELKAIGIKKAVDDFFGDSDNRVWFQTGMQIYSSSAKKTFEIRSSVDLQEVEVYKDSLMLMFHADGSVVVVDYKTGRMLRHDMALTGAEQEHYTNSSTISLVGKKVYQLRTGDTDAVLLMYDLDTFQWRTLLRGPFCTGSLCAHDNLLYIGTEHGYMTYNMTTGQTENIETLNLTQGQTQQPSVTSIAFDEQGGLWLGTRRRGLLYCKPYPSPIYSYDNHSSEGKYYNSLLESQTKDESAELERNTNCVYTDSRGWKWVGTFYGLELHKPDNSRQVFTRINGLSNNVIHSIVEDTQHDIWVGTSYGLARVFIREDKVYHIESYLASDNVPNEMFLNGRALLLSDSTIVMGAVDHVVKFNPSRFQAERFGAMAIKPLLVSLEVNGVRVKVNDKLDGKVIIDKAVAHAKEINVNYTQNTVTMFLSGLNYLRPIQTYYRVRVKGVPEFNEWRVMSYSQTNGMVDSHGELELKLLNLQPGTYQVEVQASLWPEVWNQEPSVWTIHVDQPWWRTTGVYLLLAFVLLVIFIANFVVFRRTFVLRMRLYNEEMDVLHRIKNYAERCELLSDMVISPSDVSEESDSPTSKISEDFVDAMLKIVPYVCQAEKEREHGHIRQYSIGDLATLAGINTSRFYEILSTEINKSPRLLTMSLRLQHAAQMLRHTELSVKEIAEQCHFSSVEFFITSFEQRYQMSPHEYRANEGSKGEGTSNEKLAYLKDLFT
ncbi:MAG: helix-turn-helix domain-containing protein [Prevotella sp.]|nr:helix-turn-helix domain-containing protein [Prevotella sp.]